MTRLVQGVGINDRTYPATIKGKIVKSYSLWQGMLSRCYNENYHILKPTYIGCTVSDNFKYYSYFHEWCSNQIGYTEIGFALDKDIIIKGNKIYSEENCLFVPITINSLLTKSNAARGELPIGVCTNGNGYRAYGYINKLYCNLGTFNTPELAFNAYKTFKEAYIKEQAEKYKEIIDPRAYQALMNYEVTIDD